MKQDKVGKARSIHGRDWKCIQILIGKTEGKWLIRKPKCSWEDAIKVDLKEIEWEDMEWIQLSQDRDQWQALVKLVMNISFHRK
jgi:hypothetical protein